MRPLVGPRPPSLWCVAVRSRLAQRRSRSLRATHVGEGSDARVAFTPSDGQKDKRLQPQARELHALALGLLSASLMMYSRRRRPPIICSRVFVARSRAHSSRSTPPLTAADAIGERRRAAPRSRSPSRAGGGRRLATAPTPRQPRGWGPRAARTDNSCRRCTTQGKGGGEGEGDGGGYPAGPSDDLSPPFAVKV